MCGVNSQESIDPLFSKLEITKFPNLNLLLINSFMLGLNRGEDPDIFSNFFIRNYGIEGLWNSVVNFDISSDTSEAVFVKMIKQCIMNGALQIYVFDIH